MAWVLMTVIMALGTALAIVPLTVGISVREKHYRRDDAARVAELTEVPYAETAEGLALLSGPDAERVAS